MTAIRTLSKNDRICPWKKRHCSLISIQVGLFYPKFLCHFLKNHRVFATSFEIHKMVCLGKSFTSERKKEIPTVCRISRKYYITRVPMGLKMRGRTMELSGEAS